MLSLVQLLATPETVAHEAPLSIGFFPARILSGLPFPPPGDLPHPRIEPAAPASPALAGRFFTTEPPGQPKVNDCRKEEINTSSLESGQKEKILVKSYCLFTTFPPHLPFVLKKKTKKQHPNQAR